MPSVSAVSAAERGRLLQRLSAKVAEQTLRAERNRVELRTLEQRLGELQGRWERERASLNRVGDLESSRVTPELLARDDQNKLLARGPRLRLDAETGLHNRLALEQAITARMAAAGPGGSVVVTTLGLDRFT